MNFKKICNRCKIAKLFVDYTKDIHKRDGLRTICKLCTNSSKRTKTEQYKQRKQAWNQANKEKNREYKRVQYYKKRMKLGTGRNNKLPTDPILKKAANLARNRYAEWWKRQLNIEYRVKKNLRIRLNKALKGKLKNSSAWTDAGLSMGEFIKYIESRFTKDMTWETYGKTWEIDHIIPMSFFNLESKEQSKISVHYTNLQPLNRVDNSKKNKKIQDVSALLCVNFKIIKIWNKIKDDL